MIAMGGTPRNHCLFFDIKHVFYWETFIIPPDIPASI
jgi:hypothetical protein